MQYIKVNQRNSDTFSDLCTALFLACLSACIYIKSVYVLSCWNRGSVRNERPDEISTLWAVSDYSESYSEKLSLWRGKWLGNPAEREKSIWRKRNVLMQALLESVKWRGMSRRGRHGTGWEKRRIQRRERQTIQWECEICESRNTNEEAEEMAKESGQPRKYYPSK